MSDGVKMVLLGVLLTPVVIYWHRRNVSGHSVSRYWGIASVLFAVIAAALLFSKAGQAVGDVIASWTSAFGT